MDQLRDHFHRNARRNLFLTGELLKLISVFKEQEILAVPFKGPILAALAYGNLSLRQFGDLDILVRKEEILRAKELLISQGNWLTSQPNGEDEAAVSEDTFYTFVHANGRVKVDLQWRIVGESFSFELSTERLWERLKPISFAGTAVLSLPPEELLLVLCVHGSKHLWQRLNWICDVAEFVRAHRRMDWRSIMDQACATRSERMLRLGLFLANELLGMGLLEWVLQNVRSDRVVKSLATQARKNLFDDADVNTSDLRKVLFYFRLEEGWRDRVRYGLHYLQNYLNILVPCGKDRELLPLPQFLDFLYYVIRPMRLFLVYWRIPFKRFLERLQSF